MKIVRCPRGVAVVFAREERAVITLTKMESTMEKSLVKCACCGMNLFDEEAKHFYIADGVIEYFDSDTCYEKWVAETFGRNEEGVWRAQHAVAK